MTRYQSATFVIGVATLLTCCLPAVSLSGPPDGKGGKKPSKAAIRVSPVNPSAAGLQTTEDGGTAEFEVVLATEPAAEVTINLSSSNPNEGLISTSELLTFTSVDWNAPQIVVVTGVDDPDEQDYVNVPYSVALDPATSADLDYRVLDPVYVELTNIDNDTPVTDAIFVSHFSVLEWRQRGPHTDVRFMVVADTTDGTDAAGAQVVVSIYKFNETDPNETDLNNEYNIWNFLGYTDSNGIYETPWLKALDPGPSYWVEVHDLSLTGYLWDPLDLLELELDDDDGDGRPDFELPVD